MRIPLLFLLSPLYFHPLHNIHLLYIFFHLPTLCPYPSYFVSGFWILWPTTVSQIALCAGICVLSGWVMFHRHACRRYCLDRTLSSCGVAQYRSRGVDLTYVSLLLTWHVCVALYQSRGWLPLCMPLQRGRIWEVSVDAFVVLWRVAATRSWFDACRPGPSVYSLVSHNASFIGHKTATSSFACLVMPGKNSMAGTISNFCHPAIVSAKSLRVDSGLVARVWRLYFVLSSDASRFAYYSAYISKHHPRHHSDWFF